MEAYITEEQQVEAIKRWFKQYGNLLSWVLLIVAFLFTGITYWRHHLTVVDERASDHYLSLLEALEKNDKETMNMNAQLLLKDFTTSSYATLGSFALAFVATEEKDLDKATLHLQWILDHSKQSSFLSIAKVRLMRVLIAQNKLEEALKVYSDDKGPFLTLLAELKGDILLKQNQVNEAIKAYELAWRSAPEEGMHGPLLKMKMESLGLNPTRENEAKKS